MLTIAPPMCGEDDKHVLGLFDDDTLLAVTDVIRGYPTAEHAFIGLLQVTPDRRGLGLGGLLHERVLDYVGRQMPGVNRMRLGIVATNRDVAEPFWLRMGYAATGETRPWSQGTVVSTTLLYERPVALAGAGS